MQADHLSLSSETAWNDCNSQCRRSSDPFGSSDLYDELKQKCSRCGKNLEWTQENFPNIKRRWRCCRICFRKNQLSWKWKNIKKIRKKEALSRRTKYRSDPGYRELKNFENKVQYYKNQGLRIDYSRAKYFQKE
jgi:hypothetical protein